MSIYVSIQAREQKYVYICIYIYTDQQVNAFFKRSFSRESQKRCFLVFLFGWFSVVFLVEVILLWAGWHLFFWRGVWKFHGFFRLTDVKPCSRGVLADFNLRIFFFWDEEGFLIWDSRTNILLKEIPTDPRNILLRYPIVQWWKDSLHKQLVS